MTDFVLHERLAADSVLVTKLLLCEVRLITDANYPWLILVPRRADIREIHRLTVEDQLQMVQEITQVSEALESHTGAMKMNVAALGNMVPQLHVHIVARFENDAAWPGPIWGVVDNIPYEDGALKALVFALRQTVSPMV